ncbi:MAG: VTT domain-containing protein [Coriobacteriia bacterium]|nr:VTT domain-containing protein [Coriobacteriia bacterium]
MEIIQFFIDLLRDPRQFIADWINTLGPIWAYAPLFTIIFVETGLVVMPFLPGDSLLFAAGVFTAEGGGLNIVVLISLLITAAVLGNTSNYWIGRKIGQAIIDSGRVKSLTPKRIAETQAFIDKYGPVAIVLTRFFPFLRTFAPFLAGVGRMSFPRFTLFNIIGGSLWVALFTLLGHFFGGVPFVVEHFELVIIAIVLISLMPMLYGIIRTRMKMRKSKAERAEESPAESLIESKEETPADSDEVSPES